MRRKGNNENSVPLSDTYLIGQGCVLPADSIDSMIAACKWFNSRKK